MPREIIQAQIGQCGNQLGNSFWTSLFNEHKLDPNDGSFMGDPTDPDDYLLLEKIGVYFVEASTNRYVPRASIADMEPGVVDSIRASPIGALFHPDSFVFGASGAGNVWGKGFYDSDRIIDHVMETLRVSAEACDCLQGIQCLHSLGGGTGSGLGTLMLLKCRDAFPDVLTFATSVYPSQNVSDVVVEPYNAILATHMLTEGCDENVVIDNEALFHIMTELLQQKKPKYNDLNFLVAMILSGMTSSLRFPGWLNGDLRKLGTNLVPFPRLHYMTGAFAPLFGPHAHERATLTIAEINDQCFTGRNLFSKIDFAEGIHLACAQIYRGAAVSNEAVDSEMRTLRTKLSEHFARWIPNGIKTTIVTVPQNELDTCATFLTNTTAIKNMFARLLKKFDKMLKRKAFLHWYTTEGMDMMEFIEAGQDVQDLLLEYQDKQEIVIDEDDYYEDDYYYGDEYDDEQESFDGEELDDEDEDEM